MTAARFSAITSRYGGLKVAVLGDFCLDRYLEIDPAKEEKSIETGLPVHNVVRVRAQAGGAGTVLNNLVALGVGTTYPIGFAGDDGEGFELCRALEAQHGVKMTHLVRTAARRTFTYCKPLMIRPGRTPVELNRLDSKNWTPSPAPLQETLVKAVEEVSARVEALIVLDQADLPETGVVTDRVLRAVEKIAEHNPHLPILADSRRGLARFPKVILKMNVTELAAITGATGELGAAKASQAAFGLAKTSGQYVFVTMAEQGIVGASASGEIAHVPALPLRGEIDIVGAGDAVSANLGVALASGATLREALELANAAASVVIHKLGTTGTARVAEMGELLA